MKKLIFFLLLITSCSELNTVYKIAPELQPYLDDFYLIAQERGKSFGRDNLIFKLTHDLTKTKGGLGVTTIHREGNQLGQRTIELDYDYWMKATKGEKQILTLHEFGHCFLGRVHNSGYSIMNITMNDWPKCSSAGECDHKFLLDELCR